jgi:hypothetical protein
MMIQTYLLIIILLSSPALTRAQAEADPKDKEKIEQTLRYYLDATKNNDAEAWNRAVRSGAKWFNATSDGKLTQHSLKKNARWLKENAHSKMLALTGEMRIVAIDVTSNFAVAKIELIGNVSTASEYLLLLKFGDEWKVVSGVASVKPSNRPDVLNTELGETDQLMRCAAI